MHPGFPRAQPRVQLCWDPTWPPGSASALVSQAVVLRRGGTGLKNPSSRLALGVCAA